MFLKRVCKFVTNHYVYIQKYYIYAFIYIDRHGSDWDENDVLHYFDDIDKICSLPLLIFHFNFIFFDFDNFVVISAINKDIIN